MTTPHPILQVNNLSKSFGGLQLFDHIDLTLQRGTINSLFGKNGTGKTTFFNIITGFLPADHGTVLFNGIDISKKQPHRIVQNGMAKLWQKPRIFKNLTVLDNLLVASKQHPGDSIGSYLFQPKKVRDKENSIQQQAIEVAEKLHLSKSLNLTAGNLSPGEQKLLNVGMMLMNDAELWIVDEVFSGITPQTIQLIMDIFKDLRQKGKTIFMIEHKWTYAKAISDHLFEIENHQISSIFLPS